MITLEAYAKINLTLEVLSKRSDDYHEIRSVMQSISLCDRLSFENFPHLCFQCMSSGWVAEESVVSKAARLLMQRTGIPRGAKVKIDKCIPLSSGLGGDSSDAVVVLRGLNQLWETGVPASDLVGLAAALGSDLPFFFSGGTALVQGRGDLVSSLPEMSQCWLVLLFPDVARLTSKTAVLYSMLCPEDFTQGTHTDAFLMRLTQGASITSEDLFNVFEKVAMKAFSGLEYHWAEFRRVAGVPVHLAGAGPTLFALFNDERQACRVQQCLRDAGMNVCLATTHGSAP